MIKVAFIKANKWYIPSFLTKWFTGCRYYHVGLLNEENDWFYDMNLMRRRIAFSEYLRAGHEVTLFPCRITEEYLKRQILNTNDKYGFADYFLFVYRWLGFKVKNRKGLICSEMVNNDLKVFGGNNHLPTDAEPPSPCELYEYLYERKKKLG